MKKPYRKEDAFPVIFTESKTCHMREKNYCKSLKRVTKVTLQHLDGSVSEMKLFAPVYSSHGEEQELSKGYLEEYVQHLTNFHLQISEFQIHIGSVDAKGEEHYIGHYEPFVIPLNKVFYKGEWVDPEKVRRIITTQQDQSL